MFFDFEKDFQCICFLLIFFFFESNTNDENFVSCVHNKAGIIYVFLIKALICIRQGHKQDLNILSIL